MKPERSSRRRALFGSDHEVPGPHFLLSVDVEDWFHILDLPSTPLVSEWDALPSRVEQNFGRLLDIFGEYEVRVTCFFLGWIAKRFPHLVRRAAREGHDIASHGFAHRLVYQMTRSEFLQDLVQSREILEDVSGQAVLGYRAPGFSVTRAVPWFFETVAEAGYCFDSSVFPARRNHGGLTGGLRRPHTLTTAAGDLVEFPVTVMEILGACCTVFGGGYLRLAPWVVIRRASLRVLRESQPVIFYIHPREIDPRQPRLPMGFRRHVQSYVNLRASENKIRNLLVHFNFTSFSEFLREHGHPLITSRPPSATARPITLGIPAAARWARS